MTASTHAEETLGTLLVLGATGIIGRELVAAASDLGFEVIGISRHTRSSPDPRIRYLAVDGYDTNKLRSALDGLRFVAVIDLLSFTATRLEASIQVLGKLCDQYIFLSSATVYASAGETGAITEGWLRIQGGWNYPLKKIECERRLRDLCGGLDLAYTIVRPYITYSDQRIPFGAWETDEVLTRLSARRPIVIGDEIAKASTSLTDSRDLARAILRLVGNPAAINEDFHIANPETHTWADVYSLAGEILGEEPWLVPTPVSKILGVFPELSGKVADRLLNRSFDNSKFLSACPDFVFEHSLRDGFEAAIASQRSRGPSHVASRVVGRTDRLTVSSSAESAIRQERRRYAKGLIRRSLRHYLLYQIGYRSMLNSLLNGIAGLREAMRTGRQTKSDYA